MAHLRMFTYVLLLAVNKLIAIHAGETRCLKENDRKLNVFENDYLSSIVGVSGQNHIKIELNDHGISIKISLKRCDKNISLILKCHQCYLRKLWDVKIAWYFPFASCRICFYSLEHDLKIHAFRSSWLWRTVEVLVIRSKFLEPSGCFTVISGTFTSCTSNVFSWFCDGLA